MYSALKDKTIRYILDYEPTQEQLADLNCDSYEIYVEVEDIEADEKKSEVETTLRKSMVQHQIMESDDISSIDLEWVSFSDQEIGDIIVYRVFGGNPHAQMAMMAKIMSIMMKQMMWETLSSQEMEILAKSEESKTQINEIRAKFNLQVIS